MNRRNFFRSLGGAVVGCYLALGVDKVISKPNPNYFDAEFEISFVAFGEDAYKAMNVGPPPVIPIIFKRYRTEGGIFKECQ